MTFFKAQNRCCMVMKNVILLLKYTMLEIVLSTNIVDSFLPVSKEALNLPLTSTWMLLKTLFLIFSVNGMSQFWTFFSLIVAYPSSRFTSIFATSGTFSMTASLMSRSHFPHVMPLKNEQKAS